eukprot:jgi/Psemu1/289030/fgenesh1_pg.309_\
MEDWSKVTAGTASGQKIQQQQQKQKLKLKQKQLNLARPSLLSAAGSALWKNYRETVHRHHHSLDLAENVLSRLLFWMPHIGTESGEENETVTQTVTQTEHAWREAGYGILSLHRLAMHLALEHEKDEDDNHNHNHNHNHNKNAYGTSIRTRDPPTIAATSVRIALTAIYSALPALMSLSVLRVSRVRALDRDGDRSRDDGTLATADAATARARLLVEQIKFLLRMYLLVSYWRQQHTATDPTGKAWVGDDKYDANADGDNDSDNDNDSDAGSAKSHGTADCGILLEGGLYRVEESIDNRPGLPWDRARALQRRRTYVGERTGWTLLYALRPLLWAWIESRHHRSRLLPGTGRKPKHNYKYNYKYEYNYDSNSNAWHKQMGKLWRGWIMCLFLDVLSLRLLEGTERSAPSRSSSAKHRSLRSAANTANTVNPYTRDEIQRRKMRLLLYAMRSPVWSGTTLPALEKVSRTVLSRIPILGGLAETVLWDWVLYYQHPFVAEEG